MPLKANNWLLKTNGATITRRHRILDWEPKSKSFEPQDAFYFLPGDDLLLNVDEGYGAVIYFRKECIAAAEALARELTTFIKRNRGRQARYGIITQDGRGLTVESINLPRIKMDIATHYNDDLLAMQPALLKTLSSGKEKGLHLFHGAPGTGKSTYLHHLISRVRGKEFIFLSPHIAANLDSPSFMALLLNYQNSILIIEDAEELLVNRRSGRNSAISFLLNLTDGLLGASLAIQVVCTFNTSIEALDPALLRKGRLKTCYEFRALNAAKSQSLLQDISGKAAPAKASTLADIYNWQSEDYTTTVKSRIGFATAV